MKPNGRHNRLGIGFALVYPSLLTWLYFMAFAEFSSAIQQTVYTLGKLIQFAFPAIWVLWVQRQRLQLTRPDRKGLVSQIAAILGGHNVNVTQLQAVFRGGSDPGNNIMIYEVDIPSNTDQQALRQSLQAKADELELQISIQHKKIFEAINRI